MDKICLEAPAKINLCLEVLRKREDDYHDLQTLMLPLALCDELRVETQEEGFLLTIDTSELQHGAEVLPADESNIIGKAARAVFEEVGCTVGLKIHLKKRIPVGAGLGGGSSDAAALIRALISLMGLENDQPRWIRVAKSVGADVPFFLEERTQWAQGIGEVLMAVDKMPKLPIILINPGIHISTVEVYRSLNLALTRPRRVASFPRSYKEIADLIGLLKNDLETVVRTRHPVVSEIKQKLIDLGALGALMSGSGPTVFGIFRNFEERDRTARTIKEAHPDWFVCATTNATSGVV